MLQLGIRKGRRGVVVGVVGEGGGGGSVGVVGGAVEGFCKDVGWSLRRTGVWRTERVKRRGREEEKRRRKERMGREGDLYAMKGNVTIILRWSYT